MSASIVAVGPPGGRTIRSRLLWVVWRFERTACIPILALIAVFAGYMTLAGTSMHDRYAAYLKNPNLFNGLSARWGEVNMSVIALHALPIVAGVFVGAPMLAREFESGTYPFAWTQGVERTKFFSVRLLSVVVALALGAAVLGAVAGWWSSPFSSFGPANAWQPGQFDVSVLVLPAWTVLALALGAWLGAITRHVVSAMAATTATLGVALALVYWKVDALIRAIAPVAQQVRPGSGGWQGKIDAPAGNGVPGPTGSWVLQGWYSKPSGAVLSTRAANHVTIQLDALKGFIDPASWLHQHHLEYWISFQPHDRLLVLQLGTCLALVFLGTSCWVLARSALRRGA